MDESTGLWGRAAGGLVLLGVPSGRWDVDADGPGADPSMPGRAARLATARFGVPLGPAREVVASADAYADPPLLQLRPASPPCPACTPSPAAAAARPSPRWPPAGSPPRA